MTASDQRDNQIGGFEMNSGVCRLLVRAAKLMESGRKVNRGDPRATGCCYAIHTAACSRNFDQEVAATRLLGRIFEPHSCPGYYFGRPGTDIDIRILALLFAAEFIKSGDADDL